jgi:aminopeptidase N
MDNFYSRTVYEKGAEVIRMYRTILGKEGFRKGMDLYFERHDGMAVTCDDFLSAMADANGVDLTQFSLWYSTNGYDVENWRTCLQSCFLLIFLSSRPPPLLSGPLQ